MRKAQLTAVVICERGVTIRLYFLSAQISSSFTSQTERNIKWHKSTRLPAEPWRRPSDREPRENAILETYCDGPPVPQLTDGVGQDERGKPEDCQKLRASRSNKEEEGGKKWRRTEKKGKNEE